MSAIRRSDEALVELKARVVGLNRLRNVLDAEKQRVIKEVEGIIQTLETQANAARGKRLFDNDEAAWFPRSIKQSRNGRGGVEWVESSEPHVVNLGEK
jgi:primase-polymerase (primpol)-like protein